MGFDNSHYRAFPFDKPVAPGESYSRAVEYKLDEKRRVAQEVWESEKNPAKEDWAYSIAMGDVDPMPKTGNVQGRCAVLYGRALEARASRAGLGDAMEWSRIREYTRGKRAEVVWELVLGDPDGKAKAGWHVYGGELVKELGR